MFAVTREIHFCYGHRLLGHAGKCRYLHGHNGRAVVTVTSPELDELGMVVDFGDLKQTIRQWIDDHLDHKLLLSQDDPLVPVLKQHDEPIFVMDSNPTAENIAKLIYDKACEFGLDVVEVVLWETPNCCASYRPKHNR
ncbi:MAG: 6-pyruvoyl tetrahydropterin synthase family protein [Gemmataceae bacterium]